MYFRQVSSKSFLFEYEEREEKKKTFFSPFCRISNPILFQRDPTYVCKIQGGKTAATFSPSTPYPPSSANKITHPPPQKILFKKKMRLGQRKTPRNSMKRN